MPHTITRKGLRQNIIKRLYRGRYPITSVTTTIAATTAEFIDTVLLDGDTFDKQLAEAYMLVVETVDAPSTGPIYGEARKIIGLSTNNKWQVKTAFSNKVNTGTDYELHYHFHPFHINDKIARVMEEIRVPSLIPLSLIRNADFSVGTLSSPRQWTLGSDMTFLREVQDASDEEDFMFEGGGVFSNKFVASGSARTLRTVFPCTPGKSYTITVPILSEDGDKITVSVESPPNTSIATGTTGWGYDSVADSSHEYSIIHFSFTIPADQYLAAIEISGAETDTVFRMPHVIVTPVGNEKIPLPLEHGLDLRNIYVITFPLGDKIEATNSSENYMWGQKKAKLFCRIGKEHSYRGGARALTLEKTTTGAPLYLVADQSYPPWDQDATPTFKEDDAALSWMPAKLVEYLCVQELLEEWAEQEDEIGHPETASRLYSRAQDVKQKFVVPESRRVFGKVQAIINGVL